MVCWKQEMKKENNPQQQAFCKILRKHEKFTMRNENRKFSNIGKKSFHELQKSRVFTKVTCYWKLNWFNTTSLNTKLNILPEEDQEALKDVSEVVVSLDCSVWVYYQVAKQLHSNNSIHEEQHPHQHANIRKSLQHVTMRIQNIDTEQTSFNNWFHLRQETRVWRKVVYI